MGDPFSPEGQTLHRDRSGFRSMARSLSRRGPSKVGEGQPHQLDKK